MSFKPIYQLKQFYYVLDAFSWLPPFSFTKTYVLFYTSFFLLFLCARLFLNMSFKHYLSVNGSKLVVSFRLSALSYPFYKDLIFSSFFIHVLSFKYYLSVNRSKLVVSFRLSPRLVLPLLQRPYVLVFLFIHVFQTKPVC